MDILCIDSTRQAYEKGLYSRGSKLRTLMAGYNYPLAQGGGMETKKNEDVKRKAGADSDYSLRPDQQRGQLIIEQARKQANDEATKILNMVEEKGRLIISDAIRFAETKAAKILAQARQEAREIVAKAPEQAQSRESRTIIPNREQIGQTAGEAQNVVIDSQLGTTMDQSLDKGFGIVLELTRKAEVEANKIIAQATEIGRQIIEEATRKRESEAEKIVSQAQETGRQIIDEATRKAEAEGNKIVTQALQSGLQIIVEAARIADTEAEITKRISQGQAKESRFIEEAKAAAVSRLSTDGKYHDVDHEVQQFPKEAKDTVFAKVFSNQEFAHRLLKSRPKTEKVKTAVAAPRTQTWKSILKLVKENNGPKMKTELGNQTAVYEGQVELAIIPPIDVIQLKKLHIHLQSLKNIRILSTGGRADGTTSISMLVNRPSHLITDLIEIEAVEEALGEENLDSHPLGESLKKILRSSPSKRNNLRRILLVLKKRTEPVMSSK
jgi:vacuolar-type H+-ATPase subunit H